MHDNVLFTHRLLFKSMSEKQLHALTLQREKMHYLWKWWILLSKALIQQTISHLNPTVHNIIIIVSLNGYIIWQVSSIVNRIQTLFRLLLLLQDPQEGIHLMLTWSPTSNNPVLGEHASSSIKSDFTRI